jgi:hypothetical protein
VWEQFLWAIQKLLHRNCIQPVRLGVMLAKRQKNGKPQTSHQECWANFNISCPARNDRLFANCFLTAK